MALRLAQAKQGVIINCDSVQVYSHVQIGAAKPSAGELALVPHYLYGHVWPPDEYTAGMYQRDCLELLRTLALKGVEDVFIVGGTGFYFQALERGMYPIPKAAPELTEVLKAQAAIPEGLSELYLELQAFDPVATTKIHGNDQYRILRAIEIIRTTGRKPSELKQHMSSQPSVFPYPLEKIGAWRERPELHQRIHRRVQRMLSAGLIDEVTELNKINLHDWAPLTSVGYKEVQAYLRGEITTLAELEAKILISTRQLAKRQITWFSRDKEIQWRTPPKF
jgi:tRNA dimethylallyltransferase